MVPGSSVEPLSPVLYRNIGSKLEDVSDSSCPLPVNMVSHASVSFPPTLFHFALSALAWFGVWVLDPPVLGCKQTLPHPPPAPQPPASPSDPTCHTCFPLYFFTSLSISLCLSTHLSSQRILHWSNECANSACCIKCGHPNKLHPLQGIGVIGSEAVLESPTELHFIASPVAGNHQSQSQLLTEVAVLSSPAVSLGQQTLKVGL